MVLRSVFVKGTSLWSDQPKRILIPGVNWAQMYYFHRPLHTSTHILVSVQCGSGFAILGNFARHQNKTGVLGFSETMIVNHLLCFHSNASVSTSPPSTHISWVFTHTRSGLDLTNTSASSPWGLSVRSASAEAHNRHMSIKNPCISEHLAFSGQLRFPQKQQKTGARNHANVVKISPRLLSIQSMSRSQLSVCRVSLRSSSYTPHFHKNAARSAYQSQLLIKELLYSCWRHTHAGSAQ